MNGNDGVVGIFDIFTGFGCLVIVLGVLAIVVSRCA